MGDGHNGVEMGEMRHRHHGVAEEGAAEDEEEESIERVFDGKRIPPWREQLTFRALAASFVISVMFTVVSMKLMLTTGITPSLNAAAGLLGFFFIKTWTKALEKTGLLRTPFTRQENTVIQTCVVAAYGIAYSGGFGTYIFAMNSKVASSTDVNYSENIKEPKMGWIIGFLFVVSFLGLFCVLPLRSIMIVDYKLIFPSATATGHLINGFHTPQGAKLAEKQVKKLGQFFVYSFLWGIFQWFYSAGENCGFSSFPTLGLKAFQNRFYFNFSPTYVGVGMICPYIVNASVLLGGILSWGVMWPLIQNQKGHWYSADLPKDNLQGLNGYKVFIAIAVILGDGLYNFIKLIHRTITSFVYASFKDSASTLPLTGDDQWAIDPLDSYDDQRRTNVFLKEHIPKSVAIGGYVILAAVSVAIIPRIFSSLVWYHIMLAYIFAPVLAFCNTYGSGLTDWSLASTYGKLAIFIFGSWAGSSHGGVLAGLAACGVMMSITSTASDLMQDFKTGYLTLASSRSLFISQVIGTAMGCVISPSVFWLFYKAFKDIGTEGSEYPVPFGLIYRNIAIVGVNGFSLLPKHCLTLCYIFFALAILINLARDLSPPKVSRFIPIPMAMAIPFYFGSYFAIDMFIGSCILFIWETINKASADKFGSAVASGMICGDGMWTLPQSFLALAKVNPPICMKFLSRSMNAQVDKLFPT